MADSMAEYCTRYGVENDDAAIFTHLFSTTAAKKIRKHTTEQLVKDGRTAIADTIELYQFWATMFIPSRHRVSTSKFYKRIAPGLEQQYNITLMKESRYTQILSSLRGYDVNGRAGDDDMHDTWMQKKNRLRKLEELEKLMFEPTTAILLNKMSGEIVLDDELIGSRANDVDNKKLSDRKAGKERPVADAFACSHTSTMLGMRMRVNGEKELDNVHTLVERMPSATSQNHDLSKWGLDKNTELSEHVLCEGLKVCFEALYIIRMGDALAVTTWRVSQARVVKAFIAEYARKNDGNLPSMEQIRKKLNNAKDAESLDDFVLDLGVDLLKYLGSQRFHGSNLRRDASASAVAVSALTAARDAELIARLNSERRKNTFPFKSHRLRHFHKDKGGWLQKLRKHKSMVIHHTATCLGASKSGSDARLTCSLCSKKNPKRQTRYKCATCEVPLCLNSVEDGEEDELVADRDIRIKAKSCYVLWHVTDDLQAEHAKQHQRLLDARKSKKRSWEDAMDSNNSDFGGDDQLYGFLEINNVPELPQTHNSPNNHTNNFSLSMGEVDGGAWSPSGDGEDTGTDTANKQTPV